MPVNIQAPRNAGKGNLLTQPPVGTLAPNAAKRGQSLKPAEDAWRQLVSTLEPARVALQPFFTAGRCNSNPSAWRVLELGDIFPENSGHHLIQKENRNFIIFWQKGDNSDKNINQIMSLFCAKPSRDRK